jgi:hypothetical protein
MGAMLPLEDKGRLDRQAQPFESHALGAQAENELRNSSKYQKLTDTGNESFSEPISPKEVPQFLQKVLAYLKGGSGSYR